VRRVCRAAIQGRRSYVIDRQVIVWWRRSLFSDVITDSKPRQEDDIGRPSSSRWLPMRCGPFNRDRSTKGDILVPSPKLSKAYRRACFRLCGIRTHRLHGYRKRDNKVRFFAGENSTGILRQVRVYLDLRKPAGVDRDAFPRRRVRSGRAASADKTVLSRGTIALVTHRGHLRPFVHTSRAPCPFLSLT
jgi:hypothetical protein